jgi:hypothetical protein
MTIQAGGNFQGDDEPTLLGFSTSSVIGLNSTPRLIAEARFILLCRH